MLKLFISTISLAADSGFASISSGYLLQFVPVCMVATDSSDSVDVQISHLPTKTSTFGILLPRMSLWPVLQQYLFENDLQQYPYCQEPTPVLIVIIVEYRCIKFKKLCSLNKDCLWQLFPRISRNRHLGANTKDAERWIGHPLSKCHRHFICCMSRMYRMSHDKVNCHCKLVAIRFSRTHLCWGHIQ